MKIFVTACAALAAFVIAPAANATPITFASGAGTVIDNTTTDVLGGPSAVTFNVQNIVNDLEAGAFTFTGGFVNEADGPVTGAATVIAFQPSTLGSIANLILTFSDNDGYEQSFQITNANAEGVNLTGFDVNFGLDLASAGSAIVFTATGIAIPSVSGINPGFQVQLTEVPLPGGLILLISGLAGLGAASRRTAK